MKIGVEKKKSACYDLNVLPNTKKSKKAGGFHK